MSRLRIFDHDNPSAPLSSTEDLAQIAERTSHQQGSAHQQQDCEVQVTTLQIQLAEAQAAA